MLDKASLTAQTLAAVLEQSIDCVKLVDLSGNLVWMNANGMCAFEIDDFGMVEGAAWSSLWPEDGAKQIEAAYGRAAEGETVRFNSFCPTAKGSSRWWEVSVSSVADTEGGHAGYVAISRDVTQSELDREALDVVAREMRHRLKNAYTLVCSLMSGLARGNLSDERFAEDMVERIRALAAAQSLFEEGEGATTLHLLVSAIVAPFASANCPVTMMIDPTTTVGKRSADAIALVIGEFAVNSGKHGAVAYGGTIDVTATTDDTGLTLAWRETAHSDIKAHRRSGGQGLKLIDRIVAARAGSLTIEWQTGGLLARLYLPAE